MLLDLCRCGVKPGQQPSFQTVQLEIAAYFSEFLFTPVTCDQIQQVPLIWAGGTPVLWPSPDTFKGSV